MKFFFFYLFVFLNFSFYSQTKVAILDFENTSGISKYDGFGKALSNMLITDLKNSIHPRKVSFLERSQLNKILEEQNLQKSKNFDKGTAVNFGKLAGVKYVLVGSVYVLDGTCNITSRLVDVQTSEIVHAKESNGKITNWLSLKSVLANELSTAMNNPVTIEAEYSEKETSEGVLTQYAKVIDKIDEGDVEGAQEMTEMLSAVQSDFKYFYELKLDIEEIKKQVKENTEEISVLKVKVSDIDSMILSIQKSISNGEMSPNPSSLKDFLLNAVISFNNGNFIYAEKMLKEVFFAGYYKYDLAYMYYETLLNNYFADIDLIDEKLNKDNFSKDNIYFIIAKYEHLYEGVEYYISLSSLKIKNPILKAYVENIKAKSFYISVQDYSSTIMGEIMCYWNNNFINNEKIMGLRILKSKNLFFNYTQSYNRYISNTSYSNDANTIFKFYANNQSQKMNNLPNDECEKAWVSLLH